MATISLYKNKINGVGGLIDSIVKSSTKLDTQLGTLRNTLQGVDSSTCNLQDVVSSISSLSKSEKEKVADLKRLNSKLTDFITMTSRRDAAVKTAVERSKTDFYSKYSYLKPECEKNVFEHICDGLQTAGEWCKEHWKLIVTVVIVVVAVVLLCTGVGSGLGAVLLAGACWGAIMGACIGGVAGGIGSMMNGGSFLSGFEDGAFSGAIGGAIGGAVSAGLGAAIGPALTFTGSIVRGAAIGAASSGVSNMGVSTINYLIENNTLEGSGNVIISSGISGIISGGITGGIMGGLQFKVSHSSVETRPFAETGKVEYGQSDIQNYEYNMIENPGPLAEMDNNPAKNFFGGRYNSEVLGQDKVFYRAGDANGKPLGQYFVSEPPVSATQVRIDSAIKPQWIDIKTGVLTGTSPLNTVYAVKIPAGTTIYTGPVASQGGVFAGGSEIMQIFIDKPWTIKGVEILGQLPLN